MTDLIMDVIIKFNHPLGLSHETNAEKSESIPLKAFLTTYENNNQNTSLLLLTTLKRSVSSSHAIYPPNPLKLK